MDCLANFGGRYAEFSKGLHTKALANGIPTDCSFELTERCNLNCGHCYINQPENDYRSLSNELTTFEVFRIIDQLYEAGTLWLCFTGGEPLLRFDFAAIYCYAKSKGFLITVFTNGILLSEEIIELFKQRPPFNVEISLYGISEKTYDKVTRTSGLIELCLGNIGNLAAAGLPFQLKSVVTQDNRDEIEALQNLAERLGAKFRFDPLLNNRLDGSKTTDKFRLDADSIIELDGCDAKHKQALHKAFCSIENGDIERSDKLYRCAAGRYLFHINAYGMLSPCLMARKPAYDLRKSSFAEAWEELKESVAAKKYSEKAECRDCELANICVNCPGLALVETGDEEAAVEYACKLYKARRNAFNAGAYYEKGRNETKEAL